MPPHGATTTSHQGDIAASPDGHKSSSVANVIDSIRSSQALINVRQLGIVDYRAAWQQQRDLADARVAGGSDTLLLLEHPAVYTAGRRTEPHERPGPSFQGTPVVDTDRGGKITWHGPGQLVGYPIIGLAEPLDVVNYVRRLEEALIKVCADLGLDTIRIQGRSGVWVPGTDGRPDRKVAAIGVRVARATTLHGFALNCDCDLDAFSAIVPCGISDAGVTSLSAELRRPVAVDDLRTTVGDAVCDALDGVLPVGSIFPAFPRTREVPPPPAVSAGIVAGRTASLPA
jgi:lipoyl(octanoyl) transferase